MEKNTVVVKVDNGLYVLKLTHEQEKLWDFLQSMDWLNDACEALDFNEDIVFDG